MTRSCRAATATAVFLALCVPAAAQSTSSDKPTRWAKHQYLAANGPETCNGRGSVVAGPNVNVSNECGPQSETYVTVNPSRPKMLAGGSNEIFRQPMRGYYSSDNGSTCGGVDLPLPPAKGNGTNVGSDPSPAFDSSSNLYCSYIVVYVGNGNGINATAMGVARSTDGGRTYPQVTLFSVEGGENHFNDKPMITADANPARPFRDNVYVAWDAATGGSTRRRSPRAVHRSWRHVHDRPDRRSVRAGTRDWRGAVRRPEWRGVCCVERLQREHDLRSIDRSTVG